MKFSKLQDDEVFFMEIVDNLLQEESEETEVENVDANEDILELDKLMEEELKNTIPEQYSGREPSHIMLQNED